MTKIKRRNWKEIEGQIVMQERILSYIIRILSNIQKVNKIEYNFGDKFESIIFHLTGNKLRLIKCEKKQK